MPIISMFYGIVISMYYDEHNPPHFHAYYGDFKAIFDFDGELLRGEMPKKQQKLIAAWAIIQRENLEANWNIAQQKGEVLKIDPLR